MDFLCCFGLLSSYSTNIRLLGKYLNYALSLSSHVVNSREVPELTVWIGGRTREVISGKEKQSETVNSDLLL